MTWKLSGFAIGETCYNMIKTLVPKGGTILELGSGEGTALLAKDYTVYSVEHNLEYIGKYMCFDNYVHAPLQEGWYSTEAVKYFIAHLDYDLLLVDGPDNKMGRASFLKYYHLFKRNVPVIIDDANKPHNLAVAYGVQAIKAELFKKAGMQILNDSYGKKIAIIT